MVVAGDIFLLSIVVKMDSQLLSVFAIIPLYNSYLW